ncbi:MAG: hypothetical protein HC815_40870, partial [Richelia sp. RM1_1_1]|nr:hypothetical protein [Richelia sp. RM1_1_1]
TAQHRAGSRTAPAPAPGTRSNSSTNPAPAPAPAPGTGATPAPSPGTKTTPNPLPNSPPMSDCSKDPCLASLEKKLDENKITWIKAKVEVVKCNFANGEYKPTTETKEVTVLSTPTGSERLKVENHFAEVAKANRELCLLKNLEPTLVVPEWWQVRDFQKPQLVIQYAELLSDGKLGKSRWTTTIPHYNKPKTYKPKFPKYEKGDTEAIFILNDNSKIIINAKNKTEALKVINALKQFINPKFLKNTKPPKIGERSGSYKKVKVVPVRCHFFSKGQQNTAPDWSLKLREKKKP